jgi:hypothetical protein
MSCYLRHLEGPLARAGVTLTPDNRGEVDRLIHELVEVEYKRCPEAWRGVKHLRAVDEEAFVKLLRTKVRPKLGRKP